MHLDHLQLVARVAPLIYICSTSQGGFAVVVTSANTEVVQLPALELHAVNDKTRAFIKAHERYVAESRALAARSLWFDAIDATTNWLGSACMAAIVERLKGAREAVLIPLGQLGLLPLHAAWVHQPSNTRRWFMDEICWRYSANARSLAEATSRSGSLAQPRVLVIADPQPSSAPRLLGSHVEAAAARSHFASCQTIVQSDATRERLVRELPEAEVVHFAGHGRSDPSAPLQSALLLAADERLAVEDLMALDLARLRLAIISGCETAAVGSRVPDEVVGLPAACIQAGANGVIASMWVVDDASTALLMAKFYALWRDEGKHPADALRHAQRWYRETPKRQRTDVLEPLLSRADAGEEVERMYQQLLLAQPAQDESSHAFYWAAFCFSGQ